MGALMMCDCQVAEPNLSSKKDIRKPLQDFLQTASKNEIFTNRNKKR